MSDEVPSHLNPTNDPERARQLLAFRTNCLRATDDMVARFEEGKRLFPGRTDWDALLAQLKNVREEVVNWRFPENEPEDILLQMERLTGEAAAEMAASTAAIMKKIVNLPEEKLADFTEEQRVQHFEMVKEWEKNKERMLGILPLEERKRLEEE